MDMSLQVYNNHGVLVTESWLEEVLFYIADIYDIRIVDAAVFSGLIGLAGGILGAFAGGRMGAAVGAGLGGALGLQMSREMTLREAWQKLKQGLRQLLFIIRDFLRSLDVKDYIAAFNIIKASRHSRDELFKAIIEYAVMKLGEAGLRYQLNN